MPFGVIKAHASLLNISAATHTEPDGELCCNRAALPPLRHIAKLKTKLENILMGGYVVGYKKFHRDLKIAH